MTLWNETKSVPVSKEQVWLAYKKVRSNNGKSGVAQYLEPLIRGWVNYYGKFRLSALNPVFQLLGRTLVMWACKRYKRYKTSVNRAYKWLKRVREQFPGLFYHWRLGFSQLNA